MRTAFQPREIGPCLDSRTDTLFCVYEIGTDNTPCQFGDNAEEGFRVDNPDYYTIHLLRVDHCLLTNRHPGKRCDCAIFDTEYFCLVELKLNIKRRKLSDAIREATDQLEETAHFFDQVVSEDATFHDFTREAYIVIPLDLKVKTKFDQSASFAARREQFFSRNHVTLHLENSKSFAANAVSS